MRTINLLSLGIVLIIGGGCASINEKWMETYVSLHDAADKALSNKPPDVVSAVTNLPAIVKPEVASDNAIKPFTGSYSVGSKATEYGEEIWVHNWNRMNIRIHANPGEFRSEGVPSVGPWYPIKTDFMPAGTVTMQKTTDGCTLTARDFVSSNGQAYRFEGWRCDGLGPKMQRFYTITLTQAQMYRGQFAWYATVTK